jgi:ABC-type transporter Mla subunit MlaD
MTADSNLETKAGICLLLGMVFICTFILLVGEVPGLLKPTYALTVEFTNATGLAKGSDVYLSGALIGKVTTNPHPIMNTEQVGVKLKIRRDVQIDRNARFGVASAGLFGSEYVEIKPGIPSNTFLENGDWVKGSSATDLSTLMSAAMPLIVKANDVAVQTDEIVTKLNSQVLTPATCVDLKETICKFPELAADSQVTLDNLAR